LRVKIFRHGPPGKERLGFVAQDGRLLDASRFGEDVSPQFFESGGLSRLAAFIERQGADCPELKAGELRFGSPLTSPGKLLCIGLNYRKHATETNAPIPAEPILFMKASSALSGPNDDVVIPRGSEKTDWEVELAVVIGRKAKYVSPEDALNCVAGFSLHNDYSERAFQLERGGQWVKGKSADTFAPLGPFLVTPDEVKHQDLELWLTVNGEEKQRSRTSDMIFDVETLVSYVSQFMSLLPGDVISTGTPSGVGLGHNPPVYLKAGDVVECGIEGLGRQRQRLVHE
jgi:2-keto-4-pentenoate hydratase/2-oxohepta-3-ene-1,7-dioic acid hydratase in catechol pathway